MDSNFIAGKQGKKKGQLIELPDCFKKRFAL